MASGLGLICAFLLFVYLWMWWATPAVASDYRSLFVDDSRAPPEHWTWLGEPFVAPNCYESCTGRYPERGLHAAGISVSGFVYTSYPAKYDCRCLEIEPGWGVCKEDGSVVACPLEEELLQKREEEERQRRLEEIRKELQ